MRDEINWMIKDFNKQILTQPKHIVLIAFIVASSIGAILAIVNIYIFIAMTITLYLYWYIDAYKECKKIKNSKSNSEVI